MYVVGAVPCRVRVRRARGRAAHKHAAGVRRGRRRVSLGSRVYRNSYNGTPSRGSNVRFDLTVVTVLSKYEYITSNQVRMCQVAS